MDENNGRRLIEEIIPIKEISEESAKEKNRRNGNINTLHVWWARKPLLPSRAAVFASLTAVPNNKEELSKVLKQLVELCKWDSSIDTQIITNARKSILKTFNNRPPRVLDCFAGGGSIPLEATRLGCETYASDLNSVAHIIELCALRVPFETEEKTTEFVSADKSISSTIKKYGQKIVELAKKDLSEFFPTEKSLTPYTYLWCHAIRCKNPRCNKFIPLVSNSWLRKSKTRGVGYLIEYEKEGKLPTFKIVEGLKDTSKLDVSTVKFGTVCCQYCNQTSDKIYLKECFKSGQYIDLPIAKVMLDKKDARYFLPISENDKLAYEKAKKYLKQIYKENPDLIPQDKIVENGRYLTPTLYGFDQWIKLFNDRQLLNIIVFLKAIRQIRQEMKIEKINQNRIEALSICYAIALDRLADRNSILCTWNPFESALSSANTFARQALQMTWNYSETEPIHIWEQSIERITQYIDRESRIKRISAIIRKENAMDLKYDDSFFDAIIIDPPYYDAVPYADLSDFFYVWLKKSLYDIYPNIFRTPLTEKTNEIIEDPIRHGKHENAKKWFEDALVKAFEECNRVLKDDGIFVIIFAHTQTSAWEALISSLLRTKFTVTSTWPIHTERPGRLRAQQSAVLASSIFISCRKRLTSEEGYFNEIKDELKEKIYKKLDEFWKQGIRGADFFISAIGPAVEVFGKYKKVKKLSGEEVTVAELLDEVRKIVTDYSLYQILHDGQLGSIDDMTRFYVLWRWAYGSADVPFDDARKLAQALGAEPDELLSKKGMLNKKGDKVSMFEPWDRKDEHLGEPKHGMPAPMVDVIHRACKLIDKNKDISEFIEESGYAKDESIKKVIQAIAEILPEGDKERRLLQILNNKLSNISLETDKFKSQTTLESYKGE